MKKFAIILLAAVSFAGWGAQAARQTPVAKGKVVNESGEPVEYATIVLLSGTEQVTGATSSADGTFTLSAASGEYTMKVFYLGYADVLREVNLREGVDLGDIVMTPVSTEVETVKVTGRLIVREADRFVVTIADNPVAVGKDAFEMLKTSPGVWVNGSDITINGRSGTKVMINDRQLRMTGEDLESYLRAIKAEDILKIEIIPQSGADYDADSSGGIIKITLAKQRNDGVQGNVALTMDKGRFVDYRVFPSAGINYQSGKLNLYADLGYGVSSNTSNIREETENTGEEPSKYNSDADMAGKTQSWRGRLGGVYDINKKNSVGAEFSAYYNPAEIITDGFSVMTKEDVATDIESYYVSDRKSRYYSGTVNYIRKLDEKGSTFKLIGDYAGSSAGNDNLDKAVYKTVPEVTAFRKNISDSDFAIYSANAAFELMISPTTVIRTGAKYTYNSINSTIDISNGPDGTTWVPDPSSSSVTDYTENIGALYFVYNTRFGKFGVTAGLRGEYTYIIPKFSGEQGQDVKEKGYFDLFPNLNVSMPLKADYSNMLVLSYSRNIGRPHFSYLSPFRNQTSEFAYIAGNPNLKPTYTNNISLTGVFAYKYNVTVGASILKNQIMQKVISEVENEKEILIYRFENIPATATYYIALNAPITIKEWWTANVNVTGLYMTQDLKDTGYDVPKHRFTVVANASTNISIPKWFDIEIGGYYMSRIMNANMIVEPMGNLNASIKKRFAKNKFTASLGVSGLFYVEQHVNSYGKDFNKWAYVNNADHLVFSLSLRYNFNAGVSFRARKVERGAEEDIKRIGGGSEKSAGQ